MASSDDKSVDSGRDDLLDSSTNDSFQTSAAPMHMYTFSSTSNSARSKRRQVKNACTKCQKACKKCDQARPCLRCVKYGFGPEECMDSQRKERKKGAKRGPYRKRNGSEGSIASGIEPLQADGTSSGSPPSTSPFSESMPGFYQLPLPPGHRPGEPMYYSQFFLTSAPRPEGEGFTYPPPPQLLPPTAYAHQYPPYIVHNHADGQRRYPSTPCATSAGAPVEPAARGDDEKAPWDEN
ncbi:hypothetical protein DFH06DRAFT_19806 [Mycena polygramma]|nr:hypothetical protein DFH06DRAFT_19806 [Mycena polygramma]